MDEIPPKPETPGSGDVTSSESSKTMIVPWGLWQKPAALIAGGILVSLVALVSWDVLGWDRGRVLDKLAGADFARGLITYLFAVGTIGLFVVVALTALIEDGRIDERIQRAKDILSLLVGVFGTIVGYYFGAELGHAGLPAESGISITQQVRPDTLLAGRPFTIAGSIRGGEPPYDYWLIANDVVIHRSKEPGVLETLTAPVPTDTFVVDLFVRDKSGNSGSGLGRYKVRKP